MIIDVINPTRVGVRPSQLEMCSNHYWSRVHTIRFSSMVHFARPRYREAPSSYQILPSHTIVSVTGWRYGDYVSTTEAC